MKITKRHIPYIIFGFLILTQVIAIGLRIDIWPLSSYPMFSNLLKAEEVGAYRMEVLTRDNQSLKIYLRGDKYYWQAYESLVNKNDIPGLDKQMKRDLDHYLKQNPSISIEQINEVKLIYVNLTKSTNDSLAEQQKTLHSFHL